jgi:hypothetical protein
MHIKFNYTPLLTRHKTYSGAEAEKEEQEEGGRSKGQNF